MDLDLFFLKVAPYFNFNEAQLLGGILFGVGILYFIYCKLKPSPTSKPMYGACVGAAGFALFIAGYFV